MLAEHKLSQVSMSAVSAHLPHARACTHTHIHIHKHARARTHRTLSKYLKTIKPFSLDLNDESDDETADSHEPRNIETYNIAGSQQEAIGTDDSSGHHDEGDSTTDMVIDDGELGPASGITPVDEATSVPQSGTCNEAEREGATDNDASMDIADIDDDIDEFENDDSGNTLHTDRHEGNSDLQGGIGVSASALESKRASDGSQRPQIRRDHHGPKEASERQFRPQLVPAEHDFALDDIVDDDREFRQDRQDQPANRVQVDGFGQDVQDHNQDHDQSSGSGQSSRPVQGSSPSPGQDQFSVRANVTQSNKDGMSSSTITPLKQHANSLPQPTATTEKQKVKAKKATGDVTISTDMWFRELR